MKTTFSLSDQLRQFAKDASDAQRALKKGMIENIQNACDVMVNAAKEHTPHEGDGKKRGFNVISNSLQDSWGAEFKKSDKTGELGKVSLFNNKEYAKYVQEGHKVTKHFVPWLYKDDMGTLSYETFHAQPMFGLVVGTKTPYVKGVDMIGPAKEAFNKSMEESNLKLIEDVKKKYFSKNIKK